MTIYTTTISNQNTSFSAGVSYYPFMHQISQYSVTGDQFKRETLNPTGAYTLYTSGGVGTPSVIMGSAQRMQLTTSTAVNDNTTVRTSGLSFSRAALYVDARSQITLDIIFNLNETTSEQGFLGFNTDTVVMAGLPTTQRHMGVFWNTATSPNFFLTSADGTTQTTTDTGTALGGSNLRLNISWTGNNAAVVSLYSGSTFSTLVKSQTITSFAQTTTDLPVEIHWFIQNLVNLNTRRMDVHEWSLSAL